ncbi:integrase arm-type DNA-binding domain-containing protein [Agrobacterium rhizogenes]|nr:integrase arm-type DNA-binding domain-containing protein [Rhizobium rhizogenes]
MSKITKRVIDAFEPDAAGEKFLWDTDLKGFGIRMMPSGVGSYIVKYRNAEGRQRKMTVGRVGTLTPEQARQLAREKLTEVSKGADPSADRFKLRQSITVAELCDLYLADAKSRLKPNTYSTNSSQIERHIKPLIGRHTVAGATHADVAKLQADIIAGRTAKQREGRGGVTTGGKAAASRAVVILGGILEFAMKRGVVVQNVARGIKRPPEGKQKRFLTIEEITRLGAAMRSPEAGAENAVAITAIRFLLLSGCRRMEALALPEKWLDERAGCIRFDDTKSGAQIRPIGADAFRAIKGTPRQNGWVFPASRGDGHFIGLPKALDQVCSRAKLEGITVHVLRHSFAATAAEMGYSELTIAGLLGHSVPGVTARYAHVADSALVSAADKVSARIAAALDGKERGKVVRLPRRA